jgi:hypothetical protein
MSRGWSSRWLRNFLYPARILKKDIFFLTAHNKDTRFLVVFWLSRKGVFAPSLSTPAPTQTAVFRSL